jgi:adenylate cyclase
MAGTGPRGFPSKGGRASAKLVRVRSSGEFLLWLGKYRKRMHAIIVAFWVVVFLLPYLATAWLPRNFDAVRALRPCLIIDGVFIDLLERTGRTTPPNPDIVFLGIDDASGRLDSLDPAVVQGSRPLTLMSQPWPWSHEVYAAALDRLADAGARVVVFDLLFTNPQPSDPVFRASLDRHRDCVVLGCNFSDSDADLTLPAATLIPQNLPLDPRTAFVNFDPGIDGVIRSARFHRPYNGAAIGQVDSNVQVDSMAARAAVIAKPPLAIPPDDQLHFIRYTGPPGSFDSASIYQLFDPDSWTHNFRNGDFFRGKIVMIGPKGNFRQDEHLTPFGPMDGAEVHLQALNALLHHEFPFYLGDSLAALVPLVCASGALAWLVGVTAHKGLWYGTAAIGCGALYAALGWAFYSWGIILPLTAPLGAFFSSTLTGLSAQYLLEQLERTRTRRLFERYVSPKVVREIVDNPAGYYESLVGRRRELTVLFSDLRGFTSMTETSDSEQLVEELNEYLQLMTRALFAHDGILDKFIGDAVMAVWGSFTPDPPADCRKAVEAGLGMIAALRELNVIRRARGHGDLAMGVGIHHGEAIVGDIGSEEQRNFTAIGDTVNLASRLEGITKEYAVELVLSDAVAEFVRPYFHLQTVDLVRVKGRRQAVTV